MPARGAAIAEYNPYLRTARPIEVPSAELSKVLGCADHGIPITEHLKDIVAFGVTRYGGGRQILKEFGDALNYSPDDIRRLPELSDNGHEVWSHLSKSIVLPQAREILLGASVMLESEGDIRKTLEGIATLKQEMAACKPLTLSNVRVDPNKVIDTGNAVFNASGVSYDVRQTWQVAHRQLKIALSVGFEATYLSPIESQLIEAIVQRIATPPSAKEQLRQFVKALRDSEVPLKDHLLKGDNLEWYFSEKSNSWGPQMVGTRYRQSTLFDLSSKALTAALELCEPKKSSDAKRQLVEDLIDLRRAYEGKKGGILDQSSLYQLQCKSMLSYLLKRDRSLCGSEKSQSQTVPNR